MQAARVLASQHCVRMLGEVGARLRGAAANDHLLRGGWSFIPLNSFFDICLNCLLWLTLLLLLLLLGWLLLHYVLLRRVSRSLLRAGFHAPIFGDEFCRLGGFLALVIQHSLVRLAKTGAHSCGLASPLSLSVQRTQSQEMAHCDAGSEDHVSSLTSAIRLSNTGCLYIHHSELTLASPVPG